MSSLLAVVSGDHAGAIERFYTEDASMQENAARTASSARDGPGRAWRRAVLETGRRAWDVDLCGLGGRGAIASPSTGCSSLSYKSGQDRPVSTKVGACRNGAAIGCFRERFFYDPVENPLPRDRL